MRKTIFIILAVVLFIALFLTSCSNGNSTQDNTEPVQKDAENTVENVQDSPADEVITDKIGAVVKKFDPDNGILTVKLIGSVNDSIYNVDYSECEFLVPEEYLNSMSSVDIVITLAEPFHTSDDTIKAAAIDGIHI